LPVSAEEEEKQEGEEKKIVNSNFALNIIKS
jgi:hypothetical protein